MFMHLIAWFCLFFVPYFGMFYYKNVDVFLNNHELVYGLLFYIPCVIMIFGIRH
jgi:hypothetical protein